MKKIPLILLMATGMHVAHAQMAFSLATDFSVLRNFTEGHGFFAAGQTVIANFHLSPKNGLYTWVSYYTNGHSKNDITVAAKDPASALPPFQTGVRSQLRYRHISGGWKHYFQGQYDSEGVYNIYGLAGFGLLLGKAENVYEQKYDSTTYELPVRLREGSASFKRLTLDLGLGAEMMLGSSIYLYADLRSWMQASGYPSPYIYSNEVPKNLVLSGGIRLLID